MFRAPRAPPAKQWPPALPHTSMVTSLAGIKRHSRLKLLTNDEAVPGPLSHLNRLPKTRWPPSTDFETSFLHLVLPKFLLFGETPVLKPYPPAFTISLRIPPTRREMALERNDRTVKEAREHSVPRESPPVHRPRNCFMVTRQTIRRPSLLPLVNTPTTTSPALVLSAGRLRLKLTAGLKGEFATPTT